MFRRVLIANRGEIAVRVIHACREMGIESIAVYSEADQRALHTTLADYAVPIGPADPNASYLSIEAILSAARAGGADAIHPGYGFLSENDQFAEACERAGVTFIGPPADVIARMGSKIAARTLALSAGVPVVPGRTPGDQSDDAIAAAVREIGFPVLLKPAAGGGGIGMKGVDEEVALLPAIAQARREAEGAFGDGTLYVERLIDAPRHVEFQVLADAHGSVVHLFERECSIQRRHQKVIEETPSPIVTPALRERMGAAAVSLARAAGYVNAGTVEFLVEGAGDEASFYFLEMNTRLQVEHPITEQVVGVDLVRAQIEIAAGGRLPWSQERLAQRGHAIELRVYAEDPQRGYLPQAGPLLLYREPSLPGLRIDGGYAEGDQVSVHYDPLIAKLVAWGESRESARRRALAGIRGYPILGIRTNLPLLRELLDHTDFINGNVDTEWLQREGDALFARLPREAPPDAGAVATIAGSADAATHDASGYDPWAALRGSRVSTPLPPPDAQAVTDG